MTEPTRPGDVVGAAVAVAAMLAVYAVVLVLLFTWVRGEG